MLKVLSTHTANTIFYYSAYAAVCEKCVCKDSRDLGDRVTLAQCATLCDNKSGCLGIEFWDGNGYCAECINPEKTKHYGGDSGGDAFVYKMGM